MPTLKDIANEAGVNISTVSKALADRDDISRETAIRIKSVAKRMGYIHKKKKSKASKVIGVLCPEIDSNYYSQLLSGIEARAKKAGYSLFVGFTNYSTVDEELYIKRFCEAKVDGILYISENRYMEGVFDEVGRNVKIPVVAIAQNVEIRDFDCIKIDDDYGVRLVTEYIISKGHKDICYIGDELCELRKATFLSVLQEHGIDPVEKWIYSGKERFEQCGYLGMQKILNEKPYPSAVFAAYDDIAIGALKVIYEKGLCVPEDISITAMDNIRISQFLYPGLTTIASPIDEMAGVAVKILINRIESGEMRPTQNIKLNPELVKRDSVGSAQ